MSAAYLQAAIPEPFTVLGRRLQPFTLGHQLLLERFGSNFAIGATGSVTYEDLLLSVFICAHDYEEVLQKFQSRWLNLELKLWGWRCGNFDIGETIALFRKYIEAHTTEPNYWIEQKGGRGGAKSGVPYVQFLKVSLEQDLGYSEEQALRAPFQIAIWNYLTFLERKGVIRLFSEEDRVAVNASVDPEMEAKLAKLAARIQPQLDAMSARRN